MYDVTIPLEWEVTILNQLQHRLEKLGLQELVSNGGPTMHSKLVAIESPI